MRCWSFESEIYSILDGIDVTNFWTSVDNKPDDQIYEQLYKLYMEGSSVRRYIHYPFLVIIIYHAESGHIRSSVCFVRLPQILY